MVEEYVPMDRRPDDFNERFMEQRIQKINHPGQSGMDDSLPFPIEPLRTAAVTLPQKRVSNTSSDSGVNSPHVLSPAMPLSPDNSQPHLIPSTSRMNPPSGPLSPIQQFFNNSRKSSNKEPKYNRLQPNHLDPQSVLRTRTRKSYKLKVLCFTWFFMLFTHLNSRSRCSTVSYEVFSVFYFFSR